MSADALFCSLTSRSIADFIRSAKQAVCYAGPGIQSDVAKAMVDTASSIGPEMLTVCLDFDEHVMRMGYGEIGAVALLRNAGITVRSAQGLRTALVISDATGFIFTPTPLYLEAEPKNGTAPNAMRMSGAQVAEALARLSPAAKAIAVAQARTPEEKKHIAALPVDVGSEHVTNEDFAKVSKKLKEAPPARFDLARQVRVFESYLQYVELKLSGAAIQRHRLAIPASILQLGGSAEMADRLRTTFDLIEKGSDLSSDDLEDEINSIRKSLTPSLGKDHGRVVLKAQKPLLMRRLTEFRTKLEAYKKKVAADLQKHLNLSHQQIVEYYVPRVIASPPDALRGQLLTPKPTEADAGRWLDAELDRVFPLADSLIQDMHVEERFKDVTFETLNREDFLESVKAAFPFVDWDSAYNEFLAAGEQSERS